MPSHRFAIIVLLPLLAACSNDPTRYIPASERSMLLAEARLGGTGGNIGGNAGASDRISVAELLRRAQGASRTTAGDASRLVLRYEADAVLPDPAQREALSRFAATVQGAPLVTVTSRPAGFAAGDASLIGQRRALAVGRLLERQVSAPVELRFDPATPPGEVVVAVAPAGPATGVAGSGGAGQGGGGT